MDGEMILVIVLIITILFHVAFFIHFPVTMSGIVLTEALFLYWQWLYETAEFKLYYYFKGRT